MLMMMTKILIVEKNLLKLKLIKAIVQIKKYMKNF